MFGDEWTAWLFPHRELQVTTAAPTDLKRHACVGDCFVGRILAAAEVELAVGLLDDAEVDDQPAAGGEAAAKQAGVGDAHALPRAANGQRPSSAS